MSSSGSRTASVHYQASLTIVQCLKQSPGFEETTEPSVCISTDVQTNECLDNNGRCLLVAPTFSHGRMLARVVCFFSCFDRYRAGYNCKLVHSRFLKRVAQLFRRKYWIRRWQ